MLFLNTIVQGQIFELLIAITLSSYFIVIAYSFFKYRLNSKEEELKWLTKDFSFFGKNLQDIIKDELHREFPKRDYILPIIFLTLLSFTCMVILFVPWLVYDFKGPNKESINPLLLGHEFWEIKAKSPMQHRKSTAIVGFALLGSYLKGVEYIYKRYVTIDLTPANFFSVAIRMVLAAFVALVFGHFIDFSDRNLPLAMAFVIGFFPERWLKFLVVLVNKKIKIKGEVILPSHTLEAIDGLNDTHRIRLQEVGIDNVQNLKGYNFLELMVKTPFPVRTLLDWKMQAQLICKFHDDYLKLRKIGVRTSFDFIQAIETTSLENTTKDLSSLTTIEEPLLYINYENLKKDPSVIMLSEFKTHIYAKSHSSE